MAALTKLMWKGMKVKLNENDPKHQGGKTKFFWNNKYKRGNQTEEKNLLSLEAPALVQ